MLQLFEDKKIRTAWSEDDEKWYFSIVDVVGALTDQPTPKRASTYWSVLKTRLKEEGAEELLTNCKRLKMLSADGKHHPTDVADIQTIFRIIQSTGLEHQSASRLRWRAGRIPSGRINSGNRQGGYDDYAHHIVLRRLTAL